MAGLLLARTPQANTATARPQPAGTVAGPKVDATDPGYWNAWGGNNNLSWDARLTDLARLMGTKAYPGAISGMNFAGTLEPQRQSLVRRSILAVSPGNRKKRIAQRETQNAGMAADRAKRLRTVLAGQGLGAGTLAGADVAARNEANMDTADFANDVNSAEGIFRDASLATSTINDAMISPQERLLLQIIGTAQGGELNLLEMANQPNGLAQAIGGFIGSGGLNGLIRRR